MKFKYADKHSTLNTDCPPIKYKEKNIKAFRWVFDEINNSLNFEPQYFKNPKRFIKKNDSEKCLSMALSFWDTLENSKKRFNFLKNGLLGEKVYEVLGTKIAHGNLKLEFGVNGEVDRHGHFSHHQAVNSDLSEHFFIVENL